MQALIATPAALRTWAYGLSPEELIVLGIFIGAATVAAFYAALSSPDAAPSREGRAAPCRGRVDGR